MRECCKCKIAKPLCDFAKGTARKDGTSTYCKMCFAAYQRARYCLDRERQVERAKAWNKANRERHNENARRSLLNPARKPIRQAYIEKNRDRLRVHDRNKHHKRRDAGERKVNINPDQWFSVLEAVGYRCFYCWNTSNKLCMDHFVPLSKGGPHCIENLVPACMRCNGRKWSSMPMDFMKRIGRAG